MRVYYRTGRNSGVSVGIIGGLTLLVMIATLWFYAILFAVAVLVLAGVVWGVAALTRKVRG